MGVPSNKDYLSCVLGDPRFAEGETTTSFLKELDFSPHGIEVLDPGMNTTVQVRLHQGSLVIKSAASDALAVRHRYCDAGETSCSGMGRPSH